MSIGKNISILRKRYNLSQDELAQIAGVTNKAVSTWESDKKIPRMGAIQKIADHFGLKKSDIIEDDGLSRNMRLFDDKFSNNASLSDDETSLVMNYRHLNAQGRQAIWSMFKALGVASADHSHAVSN